MKIRTTIYIVVTCVALSLALVNHCWGANLAPGWDPNAFRGQRTLEIMTIETDSGAHWTRLWLVVVDGQLYVQLGDQAFRRALKNFARPFVEVKIAGQKFDRVRLEAAPDMEAKVAAAMAAKYPTDSVILRQSHPTTVRLVAEPTSPQ